jgi:hypothetical protein
VHLGLVVPLALAALMGIAKTPAAVHGAVPGADISWPNCPRGEGIPGRRSKNEPMPGPAAQFVVVGVTNGPGFHRNPCLARQLAWVAGHGRQLGGYAMTTYPRPQQLRRHRSSGPYDGSHARGALRNAGFAQARYNVRTMAQVGMHVPMIWVDVEPYPAAPWSSRHTANRAVITGVLRGYRDRGYSVGIYTYLNGWHDVVGSWRLPRYPTWSTVGRLHGPQALAHCTHGPSGGPTWLSQWYSRHKDYDLICPAAAGNGLMFA